MCRICYSVDNRLTDIGVTGKTAAATANASVKVCIPILIRYVQYSWLFSTNSLPFIYLFIFQGTKCCGYGLDGKVIIQKSCREPFLWNMNMRIGLILGWLVILKKIFWAHYERRGKQAKYSQSIVYCSTGDTFLRNFYIMTLLAGAGPGTAGGGDCLIIPGM